MLPLKIPHYIHEILAQLSTAHTEITFKPGSFLWIILSAVYLNLHLADAFIQSDFKNIQAIHIFISTCVALRIEPMTFALLT